MTTQIATGIDVAALVADLGGPTQIMRDMDLTITRDTIMKWQSRRSIPMHRFIELRNLHLVKSGTALDLEKYLITKGADT